uniref:Putative acyltransferase n=1 Tax=Ixodes ricinus TaxID=34613 RepID=V5HFB9_IXORI
MPHTWFLAFVFQALLFCIAMGFLLVRLPKFALAGLGVVIAACSLTTFLINNANDLGPTALLRQYRPGSRQAYHDSIAVNFYTRGGPFCIGMIVGYILALRPKMRLNRVSAIQPTCSLALKWFHFTHSGTVPSRFQMPSSSVGGLFWLAHCPGGHSGHHTHALVLEQGRATNESRSRQVRSLRCLPQSPVLSRHLLHSRRLCMGQWGCDQCLYELVWLATHQQALLCGLHPEPVPNLLLQWHH